MSLYSKGFRDGIMFLASFIPMEQLPDDAKKILTKEEIAELEKVIKENKNSG